MKRFSFLLSAMLLAVAAPAFAQATKPHELEDFIRNDKFTSVAVSQKGTYVAVTIREGDKTVLYILKAGESKPLTRVDVAGKKSHIGNVFWVSDHRLFYSVAVKDQLDERPVGTGEQWAIEADGTKRDSMAGIRVLDTLDNDDDTVIAGVYNRTDGFTTLQRVNVYRAADRTIAQSPIRYGDFSVDANGDPRFVSGEDEHEFQRLYFQPVGKNTWTVINDEASSGIRIFPARYSTDGKTAYLISEQKTGPNTVLAFDIATATSKEVSRDSLADPTSLIHAVGKRDIIGVFYAGSKPRYEYFDPESAEAKAHRALQRAFPGQDVRTSTYTTAKHEVLVYVDGDRVPLSYYVMNLDTRKVAPMMFAADWLDPDRLSPTTDVMLTARDGRNIPVFLTLPVGASGKNLPMVVYPHGGPFDVQDEWGFDPVVQMLAAHGYVVLQVNYRGSSGYGRDHIEAGYRQWGLKMQDDLTDATNWAISKGYADKSRICIFGASYGGYASLMGVVKEPDLYRCAIGQVGVYDLDKFRADDEKRGDFFRHYHAKAMNIGDLAPNSPAKQAARIKVPVFLSTGNEDARIPYQQTEMMEAALKRAGVPVESLYFKTEGHGIYKLENRREFYSHLLMFLHKNIGGREPVVVATPTEKK